jgi:hypothetical protein
VSAYGEDLAADPASTPEEHEADKRRRVQELHHWLRSLEKRHDRARERGGVELHMDLEDVRLLLTLSRVSVGLYQEKLGAKP